MNIISIFLNNEIRTGGHRRLLELCEDMAKKGHRVTVLLNQDLAYTPEFFTDIRVHCPYVRGKGGSLSARFRKAVKAVTPDSFPSGKNVIMIHGETHLKAAIFLAKTLNAPLLFAQRSNAIRENIILLKEEGLSIKEKIRALAELVMFRIYEQQITRNAGAILFQSSYDEREFLQRNPKSLGKTEIIPGHIGKPRFLPEHAQKNTSTACQKLLFIGNLGFRKGIRYIISAFEILYNRGYTNLRLDIVGSSDRSEWESRLRNKECTAHIFYHGKVHNPFPYLIDTDILIVPSTFDSFPDTVLEALHTGTVVIGARTGGIPDMLTYDELLFPNQDENAIADSIEKCITSADYFLHLKSLCAIRVRDFHFDWTQRWLDIMSGLL